MLRGKKWKEKRRNRNKRCSGKRSKLKQTRNLSMCVCVCEQGIHTSKSVYQKHSCPVKGQCYPEQLHNAGPKHKPGNRKHVCSNPPGLPCSSPGHLILASSEAPSWLHGPASLHPSLLTSLIGSGRNFCKTLPLVTDISGNQIH